MAPIESSNARYEVNYQNSRSKNTLLMNKMASLFARLDLLRCLLILCRSFLFFELAFFCVVHCQFRFINCVFVWVFRLHDFPSIFQCCFISLILVFPCHCTRDRIMASSDAKKHIKKHKNYAIEKKIGNKKQTAKKHCTHISAWRNWDSFAGENLPCKNQRSEQKTFSLNITRFWIS